MPGRKLWLDQFRREMIVEPIQKDGRSVGGTLLGWNVNWIFKHAIGGGQANFDEPIENLAPIDRGMLYAYLNQKGHVDELIHAFEKLLGDGTSFKGATIVDIGCGPFTAGLALANVIGDNVPFRYFGVDHSQTMREIGETFARKVKLLGELHQDSVVKFERNIDEIEFGRLRAGEKIVFVLSYLLASDSVNIPVLVGEIERARKRIGLGQTVILYTNTAREDARATFPKFKDELLAIGFNLCVEEVERFTDADKPRDIHYALFVRPETTELSIHAF